MCLAKGRGGTLELSPPNPLPAINRPQPPPYPSAAPPFNFGLEDTLFVLISNMSTFNMKARELLYKQQQLGLDASASLLWHGW